MIVGSAAFVAIRAWARAAEDMPRSACVTTIGLAWTFAGAAGDASPRGDERDGDAPSR